MERNTSLIDNTKMELNIPDDLNIFNNFSNALNSSENLDNETLEYGYIPYYERPETYIVPILFAIIFIVGVLGNGTLIFIVLKNRSMRNVPNMYISSLAIGDLLVILFCVPFTSTVYTLESWPYGVIVCKFSEYIKDVSIGVSVFTLTALSADRYFAIVDPLRKLTEGRATRLACFTIAGIWTLSAGVALPSVLYSHVRVIETPMPNHTLKVCYPFPEELGPTYPKLMVMLKFLIYFAVPLIFISTFYIIMARHLIKSTRTMPGEAQGREKQALGRKKVAKMVLSFVVIFVLCFFPSHVFLLWFYFDPNSINSFNTFWNVLRILGFCLGFINSCINPITLYCLSGMFREYYNQYLFCNICSGAGQSRSNFQGSSCRLTNVTKITATDRHRVKHRLPIESADRRQIRRSTIISETQISTFDQPRMSCRNNKLHSHIRDVSSVLGVATLGITLNSISTIPSVPNAEQIRMSTARVLAPNTSNASE